MFTTWKMRMMKMSKYEITLATDEQEYITVVETQPMTLADMTTSPGRLVELALKQLNNKVTQLDVINVSIRELDDYEEYLLEQGEPNE